MNMTKTAQVKSTDTEKYNLQRSQIYYQLKKLEQAMTDKSLNDSLYFIQLAQKCFENEIAKELPSHQ